MPTTKKLMDMKEGSISWAEQVIKEIEDYVASLIVVHAYSCLTLEPMCLLPCKGNESVVMVW